LLSGCTANDSCLETGTCPDVFVERTDIQISGHLEIWDNQIIHEVNEQKGPIDLKYYGDPSSQLDFIINLESGYRLIITLFNNTVPNPWTHTGMTYTAYPGQELENKVRYVSADLRDGEDASGFSTNGSGIFNAQTLSSAFWIISSDENQIKARINGLVLYHSTDTSLRTEVNGTFIARVGTPGDNL
jgi:hypothetical protein